jgi:hypothetical protein
MVEHQTFRFRRPKRILILVFLGLLVSGVAVHIYFRFHLDGEYDDLQMACDCQWVFKDGQIFEMTVRGSRHVGTYSRVGGTWICSSLSGIDSIHIKSSLLGVQWHELDGHERFLPRYCFSPFAATLYGWYIRI